MLITTDLFCENCEVKQEVVIDYLEVDKKNVRCAYTCQVCGFQTKVEYESKESPQS